MDGDGTGLEEGGLVGELGRPVGREPVPGVQQQPAAGALGRLRRGQPGAVDGLERSARRRPA